MNKIKEILQMRKDNKNIGIPSYCTANELVIEALLRNAKATSMPVLIEATANQVNQFGGYTGMKPADYALFVRKIADKVNCPWDLVVLGGDHLGPLTFSKEDEQSAMEKSKELVKLYIEAGFTKIHLDTSMRVGSDPTDSMLSTETIAKRGAILYDVCIKTFDAMDDANKIRPVFIIGSEVPIPGGATEAEEGVEVTKSADFKDTVDTYKRVFDEYGYTNAFDDIVAVVVQPGVEFGDSQVFMYDSEEAKELCSALPAYEGIVFEGHSTDYQRKECLHAMVEDGIAILKVGPALTWRMREALFSLSYIEKEMIDERDRANFIDVLETAMLDKPSNWERHYHGTSKTLRLARRYSYSDRCRYYLTVPEVAKATYGLLDNLSEIEIPLNILHQYLPEQYKRILNGELENEVYAILFDAILEIAEDYEYACM